MNDRLYKWLEDQFMKANHKKYRSYFKEWINNITIDQIDGYRNQMNAILQK